MSPAQVQLTQLLAAFASLASTRRHEQRITTQHRSSMGQTHAAYEWGDICLHVRLICTYAIQKQVLQPAGGGSPRPSPKKRKAGVKSAATFSCEQVAARWQRYQAKMQQPDMQQLAATRAALPIAGYRFAALCMLEACPLPMESALCKQ